MHRASQDPVKRQAGSGFSVLKFVCCALLVLASESGRGAVHGADGSSGIQKLNAPFAVTNISALGIGATYQAGDQLDLWLEYSGNVIVNTQSGKPSIGVTIGSILREAEYLSGSGSNKLQFRHTIQIGEWDGDGVELFPIMLLNGGSLQDEFGGDVSLVLNPPQTSGVLVDAITARVDWPSLSFQQVATNIFDAPTTIAHAGDESGRIFVLQQKGSVRVLQDGKVQTEPFLDLTDRVLFGAERGLLGLAFPPGSAARRYCYFNYTRKPDGATVVSRFSLTTNSASAVASSEQILKVIPQPFENHNGGQLAFGPDGFLYIGMGDGGSGGDPQGNAQNPTVLLGKLLRIDVEHGASPYGIPPNNPFVQNEAYAPEIWAMGLRNPWRFSFDRFTGDLYIGDVGEAKYEEIDFQPASSLGGENYGWRAREGAASYAAVPGFDLANAVEPIVSYAHPVGLSVTGGYVYRGFAQPRMVGMYFYGDYGSGRIWGLRRKDTNWITQELAATKFKISTFGEGDDGELYCADYALGKIYRIQETNTIFPPRSRPGQGRTIPNRSLHSAPRPRKQPFDIRWMEEFRPRAIRTRRSS